MCPRSTRETDGIVAKLLWCGIASEALRRNMPLRAGRMDAERDCRYLCRSLAGSRIAIVKEDKCRPKKCKQDSDHVVVCFFRLKVRIVATLLHMLLLPLPLLLLLLTPLMLLMLLLMLLLLLLPLALLLPCLLCCWSCCVGLLTNLGWLSEHASFWTKLTHILTSMVLFWHTLTSRIFDPHGVCYEGSTCLVCQVSLTWWKGCLWLWNVGNHPWSTSSDRLPLIIKFLSQSIRTSFRISFHIGQSKCLSVN